MVLQKSISLHLKSPCASPCAIVLLHAILFAYVTQSKINGATRKYLALTINVANSINTVQYRCKCLPHGKKFEPISVRVRDGGREKKKKKKKKET